MFATVNDENELEVHATDADLCFRCQNLYICPLIQAIYKDYVFLHYSDLEVKECGLFKK